MLKSRQSSKKSLVTNSMIEQINTSAFRIDHSFSYSGNSLRAKLRRGLLRVLNKIVEEKKKLSRCYSYKAFTALDTTNKGYLTREELLSPIQY